MNETSEWQRLRELAPFAPQAFRFVQEGLHHTLATARGEAGDAAGPTVVKGPPAGEPIEGSEGSEGEAEDVSPVRSRHVSGQELCLGLRSLALERYGLLARTVLRGWGVSRTEDFGRIVYAMVDTGLLRTSESDSVDDFRGVYEFEEAFDGPLDRCADPARGSDKIG